jgi:hypothetical protein
MHEARDSDLARSLFVADMPDLWPTNIICSNASAVSNCILAQAQTCLSLRWAIVAFISPAVSHASGFVSVYTKLNGSVTIFIWSTKGKRSGVGREGAVECTTCLNVQVQKNSKLGDSHGLFEGRLKSLRTRGRAPLLCLPLHNSGALPPVHGLFKRPAWLLRHPKKCSFKTTVTQTLSDG